MVTSPFADPFTFIIFGGSGDNSYQKIYPAIYDIAEKKLLPEEFAIVATGRRFTHEEFLSFFQHSLTSDNRHHKHSVDTEFFKFLEKKIHFFPGDSNDPNFYEELKAFMKKLEEEGLPAGNRLFYLGLPQTLYPLVFENLKKSGLNKNDSGWTRILVEKPIGSNLKTAREYDKMFLDVFSEDQIYRLDHYLGKETLENILSLRFDNKIFETLLNSEDLDHIQVTAAENFGIAKRGKFYDETGALKDVGQNHILQMVALATMEKPKDEEDDKSVVGERMKLIKNLSVDPKDVVFGQYGKGVVNGVPAVSYREEENVAPESETDTFFAIKTHPREGKFKNVPIYIRAGKQMETWVTEISYVFKSKNLGDNVLTVRVQPNEGVALQIMTKKPGYKKVLEPTLMQFCYKHHFKGETFDAYEKLIQDSFVGKRMAFNSSAEIEAEWKIIDPISDNRTPIRFYDAGSWGPKEAFELIEKDGRHWIEPYAAFCAI